MKASETINIPEVLMEEDANKETMYSETYKEKLLNAFGDSSCDDDEDWGENEKDFPENKWYDEEHMNGAPEQKPFNPRPEVIFSDEELDHWSKPWRNTLIVKVLGKRVSFKHLEVKLNKDWAQAGAIKVTDMANGFFLVGFQAQEDYKLALFDGPWKIADHYLIVQRWRPLFAWSAALSHKVAVWIRIPNIPLELCNECFLKRIGATIGTMLKIDHLTSLHARGKFARICVEIDLEKQLPSHVVIRGEHLCLEYEGLHSICFRCGKYGHKKDQCREFMGQEQQVPNEQPQTADLNATVSAVVVADKVNITASDAPSNSQQLPGEQDYGFGPWNIPKKAQKKRSQNCASAATKRSTCCKRWLQMHCFLAKKLSV